jgi:hypothetical protein
VLGPAHSPPGSLLVMTVSNCGRDNRPRCGTLAAPASTTIIGTRMLPSLSLIGPTTIPPRALLPARSISHQGTLNFGSIRIYLVTARNIAGETATSRCSELREAGGVTVARRASRRTLRFAYARRAPAPKMAAKGQGGEGDPNPKRKAKKEAPGLRGKTSTPPTCHDSWGSWLAGEASVA